MRKKRKQSTLYISVDPRFDTLAACVNEPSMRMPIGVPHCDCYTANANYTRSKPKLTTDGLYKMVPTDVNKDSLCLHCGHTTPLMVPKIAGRVIGVHTITGERVRFKSALAARKAGYGMVTNAILKGTPYLGYVWRRS